MKKAPAKFIAHYNKMTYTERNAGTEAVAWELFLRAGSNERTKGLRRVAGERRKLNSSGVWLMWAGRGWSDARRRRGLRPTTAGRRRRPRHPRVLLFPHKWRLGWGSLCWGSSGGRRWVPKCWQPMITTHSPFPFRGSGEVRDRSSRTERPTRGAREAAMASVYARGQARRGAAG